MNYYPFNIGDYRRQTTHLSLLEHGIYRSLLDTYYLNESPLCADDAKLMRTHCIRTEEEKSAFANIIADFFTETESGYVHSSCEKVIEKYREKSDKARESANARWGNKCERNANASQAHTEGNANQEPITKNQEPNNTLPNGNESETPVSDVKQPNGVPYKKFTDWYTTHCQNMTQLRKTSWTDARKTTVRRAWLANPDPEWWEGFFEYCGKSKFLSGLSGERKWKADLFWLLKPENFAKINEGKYHGQQ